MSEGWTTKEAEAAEWATCNRLADEAWEHLAVDLGENALHALEFVHLIASDGMVSLDDLVPLIVTRWQDARSEDAEIEAVDGGEPQ